MIQLLGKASSINVRKVTWLADELSLPIEREDWGSGFRSTADPAFLVLNPNGLVPVLVDGALVLWESNTICRYLAGREGRTDLLPSAVRARARVEQWMDWQATELNSTWRYAFMGLVRHHPDHQDAKQIAASVDSWNRLMGILDAQLHDGGPFVCGDAFTLADIVLGLSTHRWFMTPMERPELPAVSAYYDRLSQRPAFRRHGRNGTP